MIRTGLVLSFVLASVGLCASAGAQPTLPSFDYDQARAHEIKPHRHTIPMPGVGHSYSQLDLTLTVSPAGAVIEAKPSGREELLALWPKLRPEVMQWKFTPFEVDGKPVSASVQEQIHLVPPEQLPQTHVAPPELRPDSDVSITLERSGCYGTCPVYSVTLSTKDGIGFWGRSYVAEKGGHSVPADPEKIRALAREFVAADFYSMDEEYIAHVTDLPTTEISISIDGHKKKVVDYQGAWVGMPAVIKDLEEEIDFMASSKRWIAGPDGNSPRPE
jgi:hypothetical protein